MGISEKEVQDFLKDWYIVLENIQNLREDIKEMSIGVTASYSLAPSRGGGVTSKKIEDFFIRKDSKERELKRLERTLGCYINATEKANLSQLETAAVHMIRFGIPITQLVDTAKEMSGAEISPSYCYKIKDKAIKKITRQLRKTTF